MSFSWNELVLHGLMKKVGEPSLAREIFRYAKKMNRDYLEEEAREFHSENVGPAINIFNIYMSSCCLQGPLHQTVPMIKYNNVKKELRWWWWEGGGRSHGGRWVLFN